MATCKAKGCTLGVYCGGYCNTHYRKDKKYGDPLKATIRGRKREDGLTEIVLTEARKQFLEKGYKATTVRQIADKIDKHYNAIYVRFNSKEGLFNAVFKDVPLTLEGVKKDKESFIMKLEKRGAVLSDLLKLSPEELIKLV